MLALKDSLCLEDHRLAQHNLKRLYRLDKSNNWLVVGRKDEISLALRGLLFDIIKGPVE
jgi:hypothetical protein